MEYAVLLCPPHPGLKRAPGESLFPNHRNCSGFQAMGWEDFGVGQGDQRVQVGRVLFQMGQLLTLPVPFSPQEPPSPRVPLARGLPVWPQLQRGRLSAELHAARGAAAYVTHSWCCFANGAFWPTRDNYKHLWFLTPLWPVGSKVGNEGVRSFPSWYFQTLMISPFQCGFYITHKVIFSFS